MGKYTFSVITMKLLILATLLLSAVADPDPVIQDEKAEDKPLQPDHKLVDRLFKSLSLSDLPPGVIEQHLSKEKNPLLTLPEQSIQPRSLRTGFEKCDSHQPTKPRCAADDCTHLEYCVRDRIVRVSCKQQSGKEYCDIRTNQCSDDIDMCYNYYDYCPTDYLDEVYPDLLKCDRYVYCGNKTVYPYQCGGNTVFDWKTRSCTDDVDCITFSPKTGCRNNVGRMVEHPNPRWYVFCDWGKPLLIPCDGYNYTFDPDLGSCRFQCGVDVWPESTPNHPPDFHGYGKRQWQSGRKYPDDFDNSIYYSCYKVGNKWETKKEKCPPNTYFYENLQVCRYIVKSTVAPTEPSTNITEITTEIPPSTTKTTGEESIPMSTTLEGTDSLESILPNIEY